MLYTNAIKIMAIGILKMKQCAILTMDCLDDFEAYDNLLDAPFASQGWQTQLVSWRDKKVDWQSFDAVIIRSTWDYQDDANDFLAVLAKIEASSAILDNSLAIVRWNIDKVYLQSLAENNVHIVPTLWAKNFAGDNLQEYFEHFHCQQLVIKPRISANADNTFWLQKNTDDKTLSQLTSVFGESDFMVQPFMESIIKEGEYSLFYFNGKYSHAILKTPKADDFRVQEEHGGRLTLVTPEAHLLTQAQQALTAIDSAIKETPLYARVDFVRDGEQFALMEAELIEPSLYFNMDNESPARFVAAFVERLS